MICITLKGNPYSTNNIYYRAWARWFIKPNARKMKESYVAQAKMQYKWLPLTSEISVYIRIYFWDKRTRDWDNFHKLSQDALAGIIYENDSQIKLATVQIMPVDKENPRIELIFDEM